MSKEASMDAFVYITVPLCIWLAYELIHAWCTDQ